MLPSSAVTFSRETKSWIRLRRPWPVEEPGSTSQWLQGWPLYHFVTDSDKKEEVRTLGRNEEEVLSQGTQAKALSRCPILGLQSPVSHVPNQRHTFLLGAQSPAPPRHTAPPAALCGAPPPSAPSRSHGPVPQPRDCPTASALSHSLSPIPQLRPR